jgi:hypothetical protein
MDEVKRKEGEEEERKRDGLSCVVCGGRAEQRKCKIICLNCGYTRDCSDP